MQHHFLGHVLEATYAIPRLPVVDVLRREQINVFCKCFRRCVKLQGAIWPRVIGMRIVFREPGKESVGTASCDQHLPSISIEVDSIEVVFRVCKVAIVGNSWDMDDFGCVGEGIESE
jgi:hypothetical protein